MTSICGKVWKFGDGIDTDIIIPARYLILPLEEMKDKTMEPIDPYFAGKVRLGEVILAGRNFGCGSSREQAPAVLRDLGIRGIIAVSFARIFFRNAINLGLPAIECPLAYEQVREGEVVEIEPASGKISVPGRGLEFQGTKLPDFLLEIVDHGGLIPHLIKQGPRG